MERAAVLIGVSSSGDLPPLQAVVPGVRSMEDWARAQGVGHVTTLTDEGGPLRVRTVQDALASVVRAARYDQLLLYFAGHGVNVGRSEYWLLSEAPTYTSEAVNVEGSAHLARSCGIPHIVLVSDSCRTAADSIRMQNIRGTDVFPNDDIGASNRPVDRFHACALGSPALEVRDPDVAAARFVAVYTEALLEALRGEAARALEWDTVGGRPVGLVRPWPLRDHLEEEVGRRLAMLVPSGELVQNPEAVITSPPTAWISRLEGQHPPPLSRGPVAPPPPESLGAVTRAAVRELLQSDFASPSDPLGAAMTRGVPGADLLRGASEQAASVFGPDHFETRCGVKLRGAELAAVEAVTAVSQVLDPARSLARVDLLDRRPATLLLEFGDGTGALVPGLDGFLTSVTVMGGELVDLAFEPSAGHYRHVEYQDRIDDLRALRSLVSSASRLGCFRLPGADAEAVARRMQVAKGVDPSMALFAAYAYHDLQRDDLLAEMRNHLTADLGAALFDVALLSGWGRNGDLPIVPPVPQLAQGWALLGALDVTLPEPMASLRGHLVPALWTQFDAPGTRLARSALYETAGRL